MPDDTAGAPASPTRLIVRGDDMGSCHAANLAMTACYQTGILTCTEVMPVGPWFPEAARLLRNLPGCDVGIHLAITSEWDDCKWRPLTRCPSLVEAGGWFRPMVRANPHFAGRSLAESAWKLGEVETEFRAQIELALGCLDQVSHLSTHMGCDDLDPTVRNLVDRLAAEYDLLRDGGPGGARPVTYSGPSCTAAEKQGSFVRMLETLEPGGYFVFVDHPGLDTPEMAALGHAGYTGVAEDRQGVTALFTSRAAREAMARLGIQLTGYRQPARTERRAALH